MAVKGSATVTLTSYRDTQSVTRYYKLQTAGSSAPSKPTTKPPSSDWTDLEPDCDISKELYFCDLTIFSNGEWEYSSVSKSSSYEAAKEAYNKAQNASETLKAESARIDNLETGKANIADLNVEKARINNLESTKADITSLNAGIARIDTLETNKADIDLANVNNAWITNGVIKDASIANEKVISVSANKLTAGTIDASKITVTNLNADNITVGTINGARIGNNSIDLNKLSQEVPTKEYLDSVEQKLQGEIDGAIETFTVSEIPTLNNEPAVNWTTDDIKSTHVGDLCYVVNNASDNDGFCYRFQYNGTVYSWALIKDNDVTKAIQDIAELGGEVNQFKTDYTSKVSEIDGGIESLKSRTTTIETTYSTKTYTDTKTSDALTSANSYADNKATSTLTSAKSYTDSTASSTLGEAKSYTDTATADMATTGDIPTKVSELTNDSSFATTTQVSTAKSEAISTASADATSKANSALDSAKSYTDAIEIGGRNLFANSLQTSNYLYSDANYISINLSGWGVSQALVTNVDWNAHVINEVVLSMYLKPTTIDGGGSICAGFQIFYTDGTFTQYLGGIDWASNNTGYVVGEEGYCKLKCAIPEGKTVDYIIVAIRNSISTQTATVEYREIKLEAGNKATSWTPAPEDVVAGIVKAQTNAETAQSTADTAKSNAAAAQTVASNAQTTANEAKAKAEAAQTAVSTKVETSVFNTLKNTVDENSANITSLTETVTTKADSSTVTTLSNTVNEVKQTVDENSSSISSLTTTVNSKADGSKVTALETKTSTIEQNLSGVATRVTNLESENDGLDTRLTTAESKITDDAIVSTVTSSKTYKDALSGKVDTSVYNTKMEQLDDSISLKATATDVYTKTQANAAFDAKGSAATAKSEAISSANSYTDTATTDMATEEFVTSQGYLTVTSDAITSKVSKNEVISAINQTAESVSINANKINLTGAVTFSSFDNSLQTTINNKAETSALEGVDNKIDDITDNIYVKNSTLINGDKIGSGTITLGGTRNGNGLLEVYDSLNNLVAKLSKDENIFAGFNIKPTVGRYQGDNVHEGYRVESLIDYNKDFDIVPYLNIERYGFDGDRFFANHDEWYHSKNFEINNSVALSVIHISLEKATHVYMDVLDYQNESQYNYGTVGTINGAALSSSYSTDYTTTNSQVKWTGYNNHKQNGETIDFGVVAAGEHTIYVRYKKDSSTNNQNDCLYFRLFFGYEPALYYKEDNGSMMYISKSKIYQRNVSTDVQGSSISYSVYSWLLRNGINSLQTLDSDYISNTLPVREGNWKSVHYNAFDVDSIVFQHDDEFANLYFFKGEGSEPNRFIMDTNLEVAGNITVIGLAGEIKMWAGDTIPDGWLLCDGSEVSKTDYPNLYAAIRDLWGTPSSSSKFKLPNLTGRVPVGYNSADTDTTETFGQVGATGGARGAWYHTHTIGSSGAHSHASQGRMEGSGTGANIFESYNGASKTRSVNVPRSGTNGNHTHSPGASGSAGNKLAVDKANMPPYAVVKYIICAF